MSFQNVFRALREKGKSELSCDIEDLSLHAKLKLCSPILESMLDGKLVSRIESEIIRKTYSGFYAEIDQAKDPEKCSIYTIMIADYLVRKYKSLVERNKKKYLAGLDLSMASPVNFVVIPYPVRGYGRSVSNVM